MLDSLSGHMIILDITNSIAMGDLSLIQRSQAMTEYPHQVKNRLKMLTFLILKFLQPCEYLSTDAGILHKDKCMSKIKNCY